MVRIFLVFSLCLSFVVSLGQPKNLDNTARKASLNGNSLNFSSLGYYINANNILFENTEKIEYLTKNYEILMNLQNYARLNNNTFRAKFASSSSNFNLNNKEVPLYEGYLFQYVGEFMYLLKRYNLEDRFKGLELSFFRDNVDKWINRSISTYGDYSLLFRTRIHMGAQWANAVQYLYLLTLDQQYLEIVKDFDVIVRDNLKLTEDGCYIWNMTYDKFVNNQNRNTNKTTDVIQDVSHGNHVVNYIITSYKNKLGSWEERDLLRLTNTLTKKIHQANGIMSDNIDGSFFENSTHTGWKFTDGWMKLIEFQPGLKTLFTRSYVHYKEDFKNTYLNYQFFSIMTQQ